MSATSARAHAQGLTLGGLQYVKAGGSRYLAERTGASLRKQATREIKRSYAPVHQEFDRRREQIKALDQKRAADEGVFKSWLTKEQASLRSEADTRDAELRTTQAAQHKDITDRLNSILGTAAPGSALTRAAAAGVETAGGVATDSMGAMQNIARTTLASTQDNTLAYAASLTARRQAQTLKQLADATTDEHKGALQEAADNQKRVADLLQGETQKAQLRIAAMQFGQKQQQAADQAAAGRAVTRAGQRGTQNRFDQQINKFGYTNTEWRAMTPNQQRRIRAAAVANGRAAKGDNPATRAKRVATYQNFVTTAQGTIKAGFDLSAGDKRPSRKDNAAGADSFELGSVIRHAIANAKKGHDPRYAHRAVQMLVNSGVPISAASEAVWHAIWPGKSLPISLRRLRRQGINSQPG